MTLIIFISMIEIRTNELYKEIYCIQINTFNKHIYFFGRKKIFSKLTFPKDCNTKIIIYLYLNNINNVLYIKKIF